jgi:hypothetical protein
MTITETEIVYIGIDPGQAQERSKAGQMCVWSSKKDMPEFFNNLDKEEQRAELSLLQTRTLESATNRIKLFCCLEEIPSRYAKPHGGYCAQKERLEIFLIPHESVPTGRWQQILKEFKKLDQKSKPSLMWQRARYPFLNDSVKKNDNMSDALALCCYAMTRFSKM